jgi:LysR family transcriptional regulator, transcription activator of glutamate synthase operon
LWRVELRQLRYLDAVARHRSFTRAARELHVAQSALSQQVSGLERELGVELLRRSTRRVEVTEAGELVLARARRALAEAEGVGADLDALRGLLRGTLRIGGVPPVGFPQSVALIADFTRAHPGVSVTLREGAGSELLAQLREGALDLVSALVEPDGLDGLDGVRLVDAELVAVAALDHPLARAQRVRVERLAREPLMTLGAGSALRDALRALVPGGRVVAEVDQLETLRELTASGLGVSLVRRSDVAGHDDRLAIRSLSPRRTLPVSLLWRAREHPTPATHAFREHVLASLRS